MHDNLLTLSSAADIAEIFHSFVGKEQRRVRARMNVKRRRFRGLSFTSQITGSQPPSRLLRDFNLFRHVVEKSYLAWSQFPLSDPCEIPGTSISRLVRKIHRLQSILSRKSKRGDQSVLLRAAWIALQGDRRLNAPRIDKRAFAERLWISSTIRQGMRVGLMEGKP